MNKPITVKRRDFIANMERTVNDSELPAFAICDILKSLLETLTMAAEVELQRDVKAWVEAQKKEANPVGDPDKDPEKNLDRKEGDYSMKYAVLELQDMGERPPRLKSKPGTGGRIRK